MMQPRNVDARTEARETVASPADAPAPTATADLRQVGPSRFHYEMIRSGLEEVVGADHITTDEADRLVYACDWFWANQM